MKGYRGKPEKTAEAIDEDGWFYTGDIGRFDDDGYLSIIDRKKELIINAAGKNMSPANIEAKLKAAGPLIAHAVAIGDRRPYNVALIVLDPDGCGSLAAKHGLADASPTAMASEPAVARGGRGRGRAGKRAAVASRADQEVPHRRRRVGARRRRVDAHDQAQAQADRREVRRRDRLALRRLDDLEQAARRAPRRSCARSPRSRPSG